MKKITFIILSTLLIFFPKDAHAENLIDVEYDGNLLSGEAIFSFDDVKPGDFIEEDIKITNVSEIAQHIKIACKEVENYKDLADIMKLRITVDENVLYDSTLAEFCQTDAPYSTFYPFLILPPSDSDIYHFYFYFPHTAGNEYQKAKYVFNLYFDPQLPTGGHIVINEVYYYPDSEHGVDIQNCCGDVDASIVGNGAYSRNLIKLQIQNQCLILQQNMANVANNINIGGNSGNNSASNNTGNSRIFTGFANILANIRNRFNYNLAIGGCASIDAQNDEWVELYNPTDSDVNLKNWSLIDNSGTKTIIHSNKIIKAGGFALISKAAQTWTYWDEDEDAEKIEVGKLIGNGLDNDGDYLKLLNPDDQEVDYTAWGDETLTWNPAIVLVDKGDSIERLTPGYDNNVVTDWEERFPPTPGI